MGSGMAIVVSHVLMGEASSVPWPASDLTLVSCLSMLVDMELLQLAMATVSLITFSPQMQLSFLSSALHVPDWEEQDQLVPGDQFHKYIGDKRGIQGHQNSCYLDATIFGLFALNDVFDSMFLSDSNDDVENSIKHILWRGIVNPLRT